MVVSKVYLCTRACSRHTAVSSDAQLVVAARSLCECRVVCTGQFTHGWYAPRYTTCISLK
jgi:hypothetical protein